jgi:hypothetical protein
MAKKKKKSKAPEPDVDVKQMFKNVKVLTQTGRSKEAIAYIYLIYTAIVRQKFDKPRLAFQTIREYAITCVNQLGQKPESVYPLVSAVENIIYGGKEPTPKEINQTIQLFSVIYKDITGKTFSFSV